MEISAPGRYRHRWWQVGNAGHPAQVVAALTELAARLDRDLHYPITRDRRMRSLTLAAITAEDTHANKARD